MTQRLRAIAITAALLFASAAQAAPIVTSMTPASGATGAAVTLESADVVAGSGYYVFFGLSAVRVVATESGRVVANVPANLCPATYPVALIAAGVRSNSTPFTVTSAATPNCSHACLDLVPDRVVVCPHREIDPAEHDLLFTNASDGRSYAGLSSDPSGAAVPVLDPFAELGWQTVAAAPNADGERALVVRRKPGCATAAPGPGLACSYGRQTLWLALHWRGSESDPDDDFWVHLNLAPAYGLNSNVLAHPSWLHGRHALASILVRPNDEAFVSDPDEYTPQIYGIELNAEGFPSHVAPFAPAELQRENCFTGRTQSSRSANPNACSAGQRLVFTRRCADEADASAWSWWNSSSFTSAGSLCVADLPQYATPILRTYVTELDASCRPTRSFEAMEPVREPPRDDAHRQMGRTPEWGDMEPALSPDGSQVALTTLTGPPGNASNACLGFYYNLQNPAQPTSGGSGRRVSVCELDPANLTCAGASDAMTPLGAQLAPPETQLRPGFVRVGAGFGVVLARQWSQSFGSPLWDLVRIDYETSPNAIVPLSFAPSAAAPEVIPAP